MSHANEVWAAVVPLKGLNQNRPENYLRDLFVIVNTEVEVVPHCWTWNTWRVQSCSHRRHVYSSTHESTQRGAAFHPVLLLTDTFSNDLRGTCLINELNQYPNSDSAACSGLQVSLSCRGRRAVAVGGQNLSESLCTEQFSLMVSFFGCHGNNVFSPHTSQTLLSSLHQTSPSPSHHRCCLQCPQQDKHFEHMEDQWRCCSHLILKSLMQLQYPWVFAVARSGQTDPESDSNWKFNQVFTKCSAHLEGLWPVEMHLGSCSWLLFVTFFFFFNQRIRYLRLERRVSCWSKAWISSDKWC